MCGLDRSPGPELRYASSARASSGGDFARREPCHTSASRSSGPLTHRRATRPVRPRSPPGPELRYASRGGAPPPGGRLRAPRTIATHWLGLLGTADRTAIVAKRMLQSRASESDGCCMMRRSAGRSSLVRRRPVKPRFAGSSPVGPPLQFDVWRTYFDSVRGGFSWRRRSIPPKRKSTSTRRAAWRRGQQRSERPRVHESLAGSLITSRRSRRRAGRDRQGITELLERVERIEARRARQHSWISKT